MDANTFFGDLQKRAEEAEAQWDEIDKVCESLRAALAGLEADMADVKASGGEAGHRLQAVVDTSTLVLMLVEQLRPLSSARGQAKEMQDSLGDFMGMLGFGPKKEGDNG